ASAGESWDLGSWGRCMLGLQRLDIRLGPKRECENPVPPRGWLTQGLVEDVLERSSFENWTRPPSPRKKSAKNPLESCLQLLTGGFGLLELQPLGAVCFLRIRATDQPGESGFNREYANEHHHEELLCKQ